MLLTAVMVLLSSGALYSGVAAAAVFSGHRSARSAAGQDPAQDPGQDPSGAPTLSARGTVNGAGSVAPQAVHLHIDAASPAASPAGGAGGAGGATSGRVNENLIGVNQIHSAAVPAMKAIGLKWVRMDVSFQGSWDGKPVYNCTTGAWNPALLDHTVALAHEIGAQPELLIDYTPDCLASDAPSGTNPNYSPPDLGPNKAKWDALIEQMATYEITHEHVRVFEVWNEPDWVFWTGGLQAYLQLYVNTARSLEAVANRLHVKIEVGGPAVADVTVAPDLTWIDALAATAVKDNVPLDFVSWHLYANDPDPGSPYDYCFIKVTVAPGVPCWYNPNLTAGSYALTVREIRAALAQYPSLHPKLWIDEWNINGGGDPRQMGPFGGAFVDAALMNAQSAGLSRMSYFFAIDPSEADLTNLDWGMLLPDGDPTPAYEAFRFWHDARGTMLTSRFDTGGGVSKPAQMGTEGAGPVEVRAGQYTRVAAIASETKSGVIHVIVDNFNRFDPTGGYGTVDPNAHEREIHLDMQGLPARTYDVQRSMVDANYLGSTVSSGVASGPSFDTSFADPGEGVALLTLTPVHGSMHALADAPVGICSTSATVGPVEGGALATGVSGQCDHSGVPVGGGRFLDVQVAGVGGVPQDATAALVNVTAIDPSANGYLAAYAAGESVPGTSSLNFSAGDSSTSNLTVVGLSPSGQMDLYNHAGTTNVAVEAEGYFLPESSVTGGGYVPVTSTRICDTREGNPSDLSGAALSACEGKAPKPGVDLVVPVAGMAGIPTTGLSAVAVTITAIDPSSSGYLAVYPAGGAAPSAAQVGYAPGKIVADSMVVPVSPAGESVSPAGESGGKIAISASAGSPNIAVDVEGYVLAPSAPVTSAAPASLASRTLASRTLAPGASFIPAALPIRICDTRAPGDSGAGADVAAGVSGQCDNSGVALGPKGSIAVPVRGVAGMPSGARDVVVNLTVTATTASGYLSACSAGVNVSNTAVVNWTSGQTVAGLAIVPVGLHGGISLCNYAGSADVIVDVAGWYT